MSASEGVTRIAKLVSVSAWVAAGLGILITVITTFSPRRPDWTMFFLGLVFSIVVWALLQGVVWVIDGFAGNKGARSSIIWPRKLLPKKMVSHVTPEPAQLSRPDLLGVHGWLFFLVISLMILSPLVTVGSLYSEFEQVERSFPRLRNVAVWKDYKWVAWALVLSALAFKITAGYRLKTVFQSSSVGFAILALWVTGPGLDLVLLVIQNSMLGLSFRAMLSAQVVGAFVGSVLYALIWSSYLKFSRRVRNTYFFGLMPQN